MPASIFLQVKDSFDGIFKYYAKTFQKVLEISTALLVEGQTARSRDCPGTLWGLHLTLDPSFQPHRLPSRVTPQISPDHTYPIKSMVSISRFFLDQILSPGPFQAVLVRLRSSLLLRWFNGWLCGPSPQYLETLTPLSAPKSHNRNR